MQSLKLRWALLCVAAVQLTVAQATASLDRSVVIGNGDSIDSIARRFHVTKKSIADVNHVSLDTVLRNGRKLVIPPAQKVILKSVSTRIRGTIHGDRIAMRMGPGESFRRVTLVDNGVPILVTNRSDKWLQIKLDSGKLGWIREDFVKTPKSTNSVRTASSSSVDDEDKVIVKSKRKLKSKSSKKHKVIVARHSKKHKIVVARHSKKRIKVAQYASSRYSHRRRSNRPEAEAPEAANDVLRTAYAYRGTPYHFGGSSKNGFDCSGFTSYLYKKQGVSLPRTAAEQFHKGEKVKSGKMKPGDLVFFHTTRKGVSHVGLYAGDGKFVHASSSGGQVRVDSLNSGYYSKRLVGARRVKDAE